MKVIFDLITGAKTKKQIVTGTCVHFRALNHRIIRFKGNGIDEVYDKQKSRKPLMIDKEIGEEIINLVEKTHLAPVSYNPNFPTAV